MLSLLLTSMPGPITSNYSVVMRSPVTVTVEKDANESIDVCGYFDKGVDSLKVLLRLWRTLRSQQVVLTS